VVGVMLPLVKQAYMPLDVNKIEETIHEATFLARSGRGGPVVVDIPKDIQIQPTDEGYRFDPDTYEPDLPGLIHPPSPDRERVQKAVRMMNRCEKPILLCGHGSLTATWVNGCAALRKRPISPWPLPSMAFPPCR
jgi:acetolactate synthase-1/2/3 large subunit